MVTIGFEQMIYTAYEGDDVEVRVNLLSGELAVNRTVVVTHYWWHDQQWWNAGWAAIIDYVTDNALIIPGI